MLHLWILISDILALRKDDAFAIVNSQVLLLYLSRIFEHVHYFQLQIIFDYLSVRASRNFA